MLNIFRKFDTLDKQVFITRTPFSISWNVVEMMRNAEIPYMAVSELMKTKGSSSKSHINSLADKIITILGREGYTMNVKEVERSANMNHTSFEHAMKFLLDFNFIEYSSKDGIVRLTKPLRVTKRHFV